MGSRWVRRFAWTRTRLMQYGRSEAPIAIWLEPYFRYQANIDGPLARHM